MNIEQWLEQYGYLAVFCGVFFEGPLTLTMAGFLAHQGYLNVIGVLLTAFTATFLVVEFLYFIGLLAGQYLLEKWPLWRRNYPRFSILLERHKTLFIISFRFIYGTQVMAATASGMGRIHPGYFSTMNAVGAALWTTVLLSAGYLFGHVFEMLIEDVKLYEKPLLFVLAVIVLVYYLVRRLVWQRVAGDKLESP